MEIINIENCFVCNEFMGSFKSELTEVTSYSEKPIFQLIEAFTDMVLSEELIAETGICQNCLIRFNEYDELITKAECIQLELTQLLTRKDNPTESENEAKIKTEGYEEEDDNIEFEPLDDEIYFETVEETSNSQEQYDEEIVDPSDIIHEDYQLEVVVDDTKENLTEAIRRHSAKTFVPSVKSSANHSDGFLIVELDNHQKVYQCDICSKTCKDKSKLKIHREIHTDQRNVICQECGKGFKTMNCLRNHKRMHLPERTYFGCDQCEKKYTQKVQLKKHIEIVHMNRRDFVCQTCGSSFGTKSVLKMHMLSHSDFRSEQCSICGFRVHTKAKLRRHMKSHTGVRDYECGICGKKFLYSYNVIAHVRNVHEKNKHFSHVTTVEDDEMEYEYEKVE